MASTVPLLSPCSQRVTIYVAPNGDVLNVQPDTFVISKSAHEGVQWQTSPANAAFTVMFDETPFYNQDFDQNNPYSGEARRNVPGNPRKQYKYSVTAGTKTIDPGGIVNP